MLLTLYSEYEIIRLVLLIKIILLIVFDVLLISCFKEVGASISEIVVNIVIAIVLITLAIKKKYIKLGKIEFINVKEWLRVGFFSGCQIFIDNIIYAIMICKMVNAVNESGNYWVANNFIWGWLLVPVTCLGEIIKKNDLEKLTFKNCYRYVLMIFALWIVSIPCWELFIRYGMGINDPSIMHIIYVVMPFYITYPLSIIFDTWFISKGKTVYNFIISLIVNIVYYGIIYVLFRNDTFTLNINFIAFMFGGGMIVHMLLSMVLYRYEVGKVNDI